MTTVAVEAERLAQQAAWLRIKQAATALQPLQSTSGAIEDAVAHPYGDGHAAERVAEVLAERLHA